MGLFKGSGNAVGSGNAMGAAGLEGFLTLTE